MSSKIKLILSFVSISFLQISCGIVNTGKTNSNASLLLLAASSGTNTTQTTAPSCTTSSLQGISNSLVSNPQRTNYTVSACSQANFKSMGFTANNIIVGTTGSSSTSLVSSDSSMVYQNGTNIEVSYVLNSASSTLDVYSYATISNGTITAGPAFRIVTGRIQYRKTDGSFTGMDTASNTTSGVGVTGTLCLDFQKSSVNSSTNMLAGWYKACSQVTNEERNSMAVIPIMQMTGIPAFTGNQIGFVLNGVTLTSYTIGTVVSSVVF